MGGAPLSELEALVDACTRGLEPQLAGAVPDGRDALAAGTFDAARFAAFLALVERWGARMDLTAARSRAELVDIYLADALLLHALEPERQAAWVDVGSGGGAPGLSLALLRPSQPMTLVEPRQKRVAFLRSAVGELGLGAVSVRRSRSDELADACASIAVARATLPPAEWLHEGARLATGGVWVLLARSEAPALAGWHATVDQAYRWPLTGAERRAVRYAPG